MNCKEAYLIAVVGGDGTLYQDKKQNSLAISDKCEEYHQELRKLFQEVFNYKTTIRFVKQRNTHYTIVNNKAIVNYFLQYHHAGISKTLSCRIPSAVFEADKTTQLFHIAGWIDAEGYPKLQIQKTLNYQYPRMIIESVSKNLIEDLYKLSIIVGIPSTKPHLCKRNYVDRLPKFGIEWNGKKCKHLIPFMIHNSKKGRLQKYISLQGDHIKGLT